MTRLYLPVDLHVGLDVELPETAVRHLVQVLRMEAGENLVVFNGRGGEYHARLSQVARRNAHMVIEHFDPVSREPALKITVAQCVSKGDRMDYAFQKCTELGAHGFVPVISSRCQVRLDGERWEKKLEHWNGVVIAAAEQSGRTTVPVIAQPLSFEALLNTEVTMQRLVLDFDGMPPSQWQARHPVCNAITLLVGPEGGLSAEEVLATQHAGWQGMQLGHTILRTETAPVAAMAALIF